MRLNDNTLDRINNTYIDKRQSFIGCLDIRNATLTNNATVYSNSCGLVAIEDLNTLINELIIFRDILSDTIGIDYE